MARARVQRSNFSTSGYRGGRHGLTIPGTNKLSQKGQYISRKRQYRNVRIGLGMSGG